MTKPDHAREPEPTFDDGVVFVMALLKKQVHARTDALRDAGRALGLDREVGTVLNSVEQVLTSFHVRFETELMKQLNEHRKLKK